MIALDFKLTLLLVILTLIGAGLLAVLLDRRRFRDPLVARTGVAPEAARDALESAPFGLLVLDQHLGCSYANANARSWLGLKTPIGKLPDTPWRAMLYGDLLSIRQAETGQTRYRVVALSSEQSFSWWVWALPHASLIFLIDLTSQHKMEKSARAFFGALSHELRTPLTAILAHLEVLRMPETPEAVRQNSLALVHRETERIVKLVQGLLELNRLETTLAVDLRPINVLLVAESAIAEIILEAETRQILISLEATASLPHVLGDPDRLKQVFLNLLDNAAKYSRAGDKVDVLLTPHSEGVCITIHDTGPGIPPEHLPHVAERLYRVRTDVSGSGLGLALVEEILRHHHSQLEIHSPPNGIHAGTTVRFVLPIAPSH